MLGLIDVSMSFFVDGLASFCGGERWSRRRSLVSDKYLLATNSVYESQYDSTQVHSTGGRSLLSNDSLHWSLRQRIGKERVHSGRMPQALTCHPGGITSSRENWDIILEQGDNEPKDQRRTWKDDWFKNEAVSLD